MRQFLLILVVLAFGFGTAQAAEWQIDYAHSKLGFSGEESGEKFDGGFKKFDAHISLDPAHPENGKINVAIDMGSAYAGNDDRDQALPQGAWFDSAKFPQAQFTSTAIRQTAPGHYEAAATLTIKGMTRPVVLPFTLVPEGDHWRAQGRVGVMRNDFHIGTGSFANENYIKYAVDIIVDLAAKPLP